MLSRMCTQIAKLLLLTLRVKRTIHKGGPQNACRGGSTEVYANTPMLATTFFCVCVCVCGGVGAGAGRVAAGQFHVFFNGYLPVVAV